MDRIHEERKLQEMARVIQNSQIHSCKSGQKSEKLKKACKSWQSSCVEASSCSFQTKKFERFVSKMFFLRYLTNVPAFFRVEYQTLKEPPCLSVRLSFQRLDSSFPVKNTKFILVNAG